MNTITQDMWFKQAVILYSYKKGGAAATKQYKTTRQNIYRWRKKYGGNGRIDFVLGICIEIAVILTENIKAEARYRAEVEIIERPMLNSATGDFILDEEGFQIMEEYEQETEVSYTYYIRTVSHPFFADRLMRSSKIPYSILASAEMFQKHLSVNSIWGTR